MLVLAESGNDLRQRQVDPLEHEEHELPAEMPPELQGEDGRVRSTGARRHTRQPAIAIMT